MPATATNSTVEDAFVALYRDEFAFVWRMVVHFGIVEPAAIEDATQDVFIVVHRRWADWQPGVSARSWLYGIVRRVASDHRRSHGRHSRKIESLPEPPRPRDLEAEFAERQLLGWLEHALDELEPVQREAFVLAELEGMTAREIADATGANPNTVASRLRAARRHVSGAFEKHRPGPHGQLQGSRHARA